MALAWAVLVRAVLVLVVIALFAGAFWLGYHPDQSRKDGWQMVGVVSACIAWFAGLWWAMAVLTT